MLKWAGLAGRRAEAVGIVIRGEASVLEFVRHRLVEDELGDGLGLGEIECGGLIQEEISDHAFHRGALARARAR